MMTTVLRRAILTAAGSEGLRNIVENVPFSRDVVRRFVGGASATEAVGAAAGLAGQGLRVTIDHLGEDTTNRADAEATRDAYLNLLTQLDESGLTAGGKVEVSVKLSAVGQSLGPDGPAVATDFAHQICSSAAEVGTTVTIDMEDHTTTDSTLATIKELRQDFPWVGAVLQAYLYRTEGDCKDLAGPGSRVRLCKGAYREPESVAYQSSQDVAKSYVRCMSILMAGQGYPMLATHDPRLIEIGGSLAAKNHRAAGSFEYQMLFGIRPDEQNRLAGLGETVRVYLPYGSQWYGYLMRRMAEKPANTMLFLRALSSRK